MSSQFIKFLNKSKMNFQDGINLMFLYAKNKSFSQYVENDLQIDTLCNCIRYLYYLSDNAGCFALLLMSKQMIKYLKFLKQKKEIPKAIKQKFDKILSQEKLKEQNKYSSILLKIYQSTEKEYIKDLCLRIIWKFYRIDQRICEYEKLILSQR